MSKLIKALAGALTMVAIAAAAETSSPVVFWAHFMPQVGTNFGEDIFITRTGGEPDGYERQILSALDSGINGFQMLTFVDPRMLEAAKRVKAKTGQLFYVNPQWCDQSPDFDISVGQIADFAVKHKDDPHVFKLDGKQLHFFYNYPRWAGQDGSGFDKARELIKAKGVEVLFIPETYHPDQLLLDNPGIKPDFKNPELGPLKWISETKWDGIDSWGLMDCPESLAKPMLERAKLRPNGRPFVFLPMIAWGYDSSGRPAQAIHVPNYGLKVLRDNLKLWVGLGCKQFDIVTWNDTCESLLVPWTRNPFGFNEVIRYYRQLAEDGRSPFSSPKTVVSYEPEVILGDELFFQFLHLPERGAPSCDYICQVRLEGLDGKEVAALSARSTVQGEGADTLSEVRFDTMSLPAGTEILSPVVTVLKANRITNERELVYKELRLPPLVLRHNRINDPLPYAIALDHVAPDLSLSLKLKDAPGAFHKLPSGSLQSLVAEVNGAEGLRKLGLGEGQGTLGLFRQDDDGTKAFLKVKADAEFKYNLKLSSGTMLERFVWHWDPMRTVTAVNAPSFESSTFPNGEVQAGLDGWWHVGIAGAAYRVAADPDAKITLSVVGKEGQTMETSLAELAKGAVTKTLETPKGKANVRLEIGLAACALNSDYPLPKHGDFARPFPVEPHADATRYLHLWALTASDKVAWSRPLALVREGDGKASMDDPEEPVRCHVVHSRGTFDDFVDAHSSGSRSYFAAADVQELEIPARRVPYILLDCDEGAGDLLNDSGMGNQLGRGWLEGSYEWLADGWRGSALRLKGGHIQLRSKSSPFGEYTFSARVRVQAKPPYAVVGGDGDSYQGITTQGRIDILPDGRVRASRQGRGGEGEVVSKDRVAGGDQWTSIIVTHDQRKLRIYLDGRLSGEGDMSAPTLQRTHSAPTVGFSGVAAKLTPKGEPVPGFTGDIDQIEIIGAALDDDAGEAAI